MQHSFMNHIGKIPIIFFLLVNNIHAAYNTGAKNTPVTSLYATCMQKIAGNPEIAKVAFNRLPIIVRNPIFMHHMRQALQKRIVKKDILKGHADKVSGLCVSPNQQELVSCSQDGTIRLWNLINHTQQIITEQRSPAHICSFNHQGNQCATITDHSLHIYDRTGHLLCEHAFDDQVQKIHFSPDDQYILAQLSNTLGIYDTNTGRYNTIAGSIDHQPFAADKNTCLIRKQEHLYLYDFKTDKIIHTKTCDAPIKQATCDAVGKHMAIAHPQCIRIYESAFASEPIKELKCWHTGTQVAFSFDGSTIVSTENNHPTTVRPLTGKSTKEQIHKKNILRTLIHPQGTSCASFYLDGSIELLNVNSARTQAHLKPHSKASTSAFTFGQDLCASAHDTDIYVWQDFTDLARYANDNKMQYFLMHATYDWKRGQPHCVAQKDRRLHQRLIQNHTYLDNKKLFTV